MKRIISLILVSVMTLLAFCACGNTTDADDKSTDTPAVSGTDTAAADTTADDTAASDYDYIKNKGKLIVGITEYEPMNYKDENGEWTGFDTEFAQAVCEKLGVEAEFIVIDWDNKIMELDSKNIDVVWNGMTLTPEVTESMECTNAYCNNAQVVVVPAE